MFYKLNFCISIFLFLLTITYRNKILHNLTNNVKTIQNLLVAWNIVMLISIALLLLYSLWIGYKYSNWRFYAFGGIALVMLLISIIGIFVTPRGTL